MSNACFYKLTYPMIQSTETQKKWWQFGHVWLVIAGPAVVVVAGFVTFYIAVSSPNEMVSEDTGSISRQTDQSIEASRKNFGSAPALVGRNHAATGEVPAK